MTTSTKRAIYLLGLLIFCSCSSSAQRTQNCAIQKPNRFVTDQAYMLSRTTSEYLERRLAKLKKDRTVELAVVGILTTGTKPVDDYSLELARCWGIGPAARGGGVLVLVARDDRKWRIQVTTSLEDKLPDARVKQIGDRMATEFKSQRYDQGIRQAVDDLIAELEK
jgi:uncharacterized protein